MNVNNSLERRYSFNMAQATPVADSTHLNSSGFCWGSSLCPKQRSNSSLCLNNLQSDYNNKSILSPKSRSVTKIDARIFADVKSKGLASRIVKYHESGTKMNRSMSAQNLHIKPGQFPAVTLKKTDLPYRATKQELSMIRIPAPENSSFYGNTISSLLKSSSVIGLHSKRTDDLCRENRPIIHPPPTENDMAPTRSVLDELKEISRKRINSDDLEVDETSKKYCNRIRNDIVDTANVVTSEIPQNFATSSIPSCQRHKRQRDCITNHQSVQISENKTSPEQQAKKRLCSYNNDITSSLSSSIKNKVSENAKRMSTFNNMCQTMPTNVELYEMQKTKVQRYYQEYNNSNNNTWTDVRFANLENDLKKVDTLKVITPIPATPCVQDQSKMNEVLPKQKASEPSYNSEREIMKPIQSTNKPRITLFNKKCDDEKTKIGESMIENTDNVNSFAEFAGIPFVKPKKLSSINGLRNPVMERTQKSKLALMLSGLRGELYQNSVVDELDSSNTNFDKTKDIKYNNNNNNSKIVKSSIQLTTSLNTVTTSNTINFDSNKETSSPTSTIISTNKTMSPLVGLKLSQPKQESEIVTNTTENTNFTNSPEIISKSSVPVLGGFSFGVTKTSSPEVVNTTTSNNLSKVSNSVTTTNSFITNNKIKDTSNFGQTTQITSTSLPFINSNEDKLSLRSSVKDNDLHFPAICTVFSIPTTTNSYSATSSSRTTNSDFTFGTNLTSTPLGNTTTSKSSGIPSNDLSTSYAFNTTTPTTAALSTVSAVPIMFRTLPSLISSTNTTPLSSIVASSTTSALTFDTVPTSTNLPILTSTSSFSFNTPKQLTTNEAASSSGGISTKSFSFGSNITVPSFPTFEKTKKATESHSANSSFSLSNPNHNSEIQKSTAVNKTDNNIFDTNSSMLFGSSSFNEPSTREVNSIFGNNTTNSSEKNIFNSSNTTLLSSNSVKTDTQTDGSEKSTVLATSSVFGGNFTNKSTPTQFNFGIKPAIAQTETTKSAIHSSGGFSFSSEASKTSKGVAAIAFDSKISGPIKTTNNAFDMTTTPALQNKSFSFVSSANKAHNQSNFSGEVNKPAENTTSPGGFSFGSAMAPKTSTFSFGGSENSFSGSNASIKNNSAVGFSFGGAVPLKHSEPSSASKPFSFGSSQPSQQQQQIIPVPNNNIKTSNIFSSSGANKATPPFAFNFSAGSSTNLQSSAPSTNNIFAPSSNVTTGPGERQIRRATRRLQK